MEPSPGGEKGKAAGAANKVLAAFACLAFIVPVALGGRPLLFHEGDRGKAGDIWEAIRDSVSRMGLDDFAILLTLLALIGWLTWRGMGPRKFGRADRGFTEYDWENSSPLVRFLTTFFILVLLALFIILVAS
jgi:hypothetical protein